MAAAAFHLKARRLVRSSRLIYDSPATANLDTKDDPNSSPAWLSPAIEPMIKYLFDKNMKDENVPLFQNWSMYSLSLPVREFSGGILKLYTLKYFAPYKYLRAMAEDLARETIDYRGWIKYLAAPAASGKTCSVLPAFIESSTLSTNGGTHYLYLAFANNKNRHFLVYPHTPSSDVIKANMQGAAFMVKCVESLLNDP